MEFEKQELRKFQDWQKLCNATIDPFILLDLKGNVLILNKEAAKLLDKSVDELIGWNSYDFMAPNDVKFFKAQINNITRLRKPVRVEKEIFGRTFDLSISLIFDEQGKVEQIAFFFRDITERKQVEAALKSTKSWFEQLLFNNPAVIFSFTPQRDFTINFISENIKERLGYEPREFMNDSQLWIDCVHPDDLPGIFSQLPVLLEKGAIISEYRFKHKDGTYRWLYDEKKVIFDTKGQPIEVIGSWLDITERKIQEKELKEKEVELSKSEKKFKKICIELESLLDIIPGIVFSVDKNGSITRANQKTANFLELNKEDLIGKPIFTFLPEDQAKRMWENDLKVINSGNPLLNLEEMVETRYGKKYFNTNIVPHCNEDNEVDGVIGLVIDITELKKNEEQIKESEKKYKNSNTELETLIDLIPGSVFSIDKNSVVIRANQNLVNSIGLNKEEVIGKSIFDVYPEDIAKRIRKVDLDIISNGKAVFNLEEEVDGPYGKRWVLTNKGPHFNTAGEIIGIIGLVIDITERKKIEVQLKKSKEAFQNAYDRMLLYQNLITHDIRNVLNSVQSLTYLYNRDRNNHSKLNEILKMTNEQIVKGDRLIRNVISLSDLESKHIFFKPVDVLNVLEESIKFLYGRFLNREISIKVDSANSEFIAQGDDFLIDVFENILNNAVKHNPNPNVEILIKIAKKERGMKKYIQFEFNDNGNGIPDIRKQSIFQRNRPKKEYLKGLGIGLSLVCKIINNYGGEIWVEDKVKGDRSKGSKFVILIPEAY